MPTLARVLALVAVIWLVGAWLRIYRQARFYQIEEYDSRRYLRWLLASPRRWLPVRPVAAWLAVCILTLLFARASASNLPAFAAILGAIAAAIPPPEGEVKKPFRATPRAKRLLGAAFVVAGALVALAVTGIGAAGWPDDTALIGAATVGLAALVAAPLALVAGNLLMTPVEALFRRRFLESARRVLADVHPVVIGITGSYGKTTTKHILAQILNGRYHAYATPKSYNTLMGISLAINNDLARDHSVDYFIAEMGAYVPGEIDRLCDLTQPAIGIVTEVGPQHMERFGTLDNTARAKYELIANLPPDGVGVFNWDNPYVREMFERGYPATRIAVSREVDPSNPPDGPRFIASDIDESLAGLRFTVTDRDSGQSERFETPLTGLHNVTNILLATAVAIHEGMSLRDVARRARALQPAESRLATQTTDAGITIINDAYSANPVGAASALRVLGLYPGRRLLVTPGMVELGPLMESENRRLGEIAARYATDVILVGHKQAEPIRAGLLDAGFPAERLRVVPTLADSIQWYQNNLHAGDVVLFLNDLPDTYLS